MSDKQPTPTPSWVSTTNSPTPSGGRFNSSSSPNGTNVFRDNSQYMTTDAQVGRIVQEVLISIAAVVVLAAVYCSYRRKKRLERLRAAARPPLLPNEHVGHLYGLKRDALEDPTLEADKWTCGVCAFRNAKDRVECVLCHTTRNAFMLAMPEFNQAKDGAVAMGQLNDKQRSARQRKQWQRGLDTNNKYPIWVMTEELATPRPFYIVTKSTPPAGETKDSNMSLTLVPWTEKLELHSLVDGAPISKWWIQQSSDLTSLSFSLKYSWLLQQMAGAVEGYTKLKVYRAELFRESIQILNLIPEDQLCTMTKISLLGESGIDAGGVTREWYTLLSSAIFEPDQGLFITNKADQSLFINPNSATHHGPNHLQVYHAIGRLLGKAIVDGQVLPFQFSVPLFKALLGYPVSIEDIRYLDPVVYSSLVFVRDCNSDVAELALTFSATLDASTEVDLVPNGRAIEVTCANKAEYIERMVQYLLFDRVAPQLEKIVQGLYDVLPQELLMPFDYKELELVLCGFAEIDVADWKRSTNVTENLKDVVNWFWDIVFGLTSAERAKLLQFTTGSSRVPLQGFKGMTSYDGKLCPFSLYGIRYTRGAFPKVHSCFNRIDLPIYPTRDLLEEGIQVLLRIDDAVFSMA
ncbi:Aste57867_2947 [Aphanomyces stellatus]|uniref:HECT-type E3 ubiquitin transferase n=1 Tax=Aphanomyces stellatus TaxID=120398 RepID=A0A485KEC3_9STRA|nr:hypothetical protein As57867_002938 [Aphanomyces stellatus]VFT80130.1 Aste57867_2947 [Aphanomyces stellatus]